MSFGEGCKGFSLVELVITLIVVGIMAITIIPKWNGRSGFDERGFRDEIVAGLRYAQKSAIAARRTVCATFVASPPQVTFTIAANPNSVDCSTGSGLIAPDGVNVLVVRAKGAAGFSSMPTGVVFDSAGRTNSSTSIAISGLPLTLSVTVEAETGYVH